MVTILLVILLVLAATCIFVQRRKYIQEKSGHNGSNGIRYTDRDNPVFKTGQLNVSSSTDPHTHINVAGKYNGSQSAAVDDDGHVYETLPEDNLDCVEHQYDVTAKTTNNDYLELEVYKKENKNDYSELEVTMEELNNDYLDAMS